MTNNLRLFAIFKQRSEVFFSATVLLVVMGVVTRLVTLLTQIVIAHEFGLSSVSDAFFATENIPELFIDFVTIGFSMVFIPMFTEFRQRKGEVFAQRFATSFLLLSVVLAFIVAVVSILGAPLLVAIIAPGFRGETRETAITLVRIMSLATVFFGLDAGLRGILHAHNRFLIPEWARVVYNATLFLVALLLSGRFGIYVLAWGIVLGALFGVIVQAWGAVRLGVFNLTWGFDRANTLQAAKQLLPFVLAISGVKILFFLDRVVASGLPAGDLAALNYATRIILLPVGLFALPLRTVLYPTLSTLAAQAEYIRFGQTVLSGLKVLLYMTLPACVGLVVLHTPLTQILFEGGEFDRSATLATSIALTYYAIGVPAIALIFVLNNVFLALDRAALLIRLNLMGWLLNIGLSYGLSQIMGHVGIAFGTAITAMAMIAVMFYLLQRTTIQPAAMKMFGREVGRITLVALIMGGVVELLLMISSTPLVLSSIYYQSIQVALLSLIGALTYLVVGRLFRIDGLQLLKSTFWEGRGETAAS